MAAGIATTSRPSSRPTGAGPRCANDGLSGTQSDAGESRLDGVLARERPAYTLILYGTNDWNELECKVEFPCFTIDSLRSMIRQAKDRNSLPVVGTIPPVNPAYADKAPPERQDWVKRMNDLIRPMVAAGERPSRRRPRGDAEGGRPAAIFTDHVHPNDRGYQIMAHEWFRAIIDPLGRRFEPVAASPSSSTRSSCRRLAGARGPLRPRAARERSPLAVTGATRRPAAAVVSSGTP